MKKLATYYFIVLALLNLYGQLSLADLHKHTYKLYLKSLMGPKFYSEMREGHDLDYMPAISQFVMKYSWWPFIIVGLSLVGAIVSLVTSIRSSALCHFVIALVAADAFMLFLTVIAYLLPFYDGTVALSP